MEYDSQSSDELAEDKRLEKLLEAEQEYEDGTDSKIK